MSECPVSWSDIRGAVQDFVRLIEEGAGAVSENEACLPLLLDRLAFNQHYVINTFDEIHYPDPPERDHAVLYVLYALICDRFPNYGYYNVPASITGRIGDSDCIVGDAIDDLLDIYCELVDVGWRWSHTSESDALWHLQFSFRSHWRGHLRGIQFYLDALEFDQ
ncbi:MAG: DUF5063 domain-containing protein [Cyanobacteria bacterium P01_A01_bin.17]